MSGDVERRAKRFGILAGALAAAAGLAKIAGAPTWAVLTFSAAGIAGLAAGWLLTERQWAAEARDAREERWLVPPATLHELRHDESFYKLGVDTEEFEPLRTAGHGELKHAPYVERDVVETVLR